MNEKASVQVAVRIRPLNKRESDTDIVIESNGPSIHIRNPEDRKRKKFDFDFTYDLDSTQLNVYDDIGVRIVDNAFHGYNTCVFAYGQTGSGKSHVIMGPEDNPGLIPRICQELFDKQNSHNGIPVQDIHITYKIELSYLEIYSEDVRDLLSGTPRVGLRVREHPELGPYVEGLGQVLVEDFASIKKLIDQGNKERMTASTLMNQHSSRSHAILTLYFTQLIDEPSIGKTREIVSKVNLVDLAGSERVEMSGVTGINFKEAININKSLSTLGLVISKLAFQSQHKLRPSASAIKNKQHVQNKSRTTPDRNTSIADHIPFRDSVLTWILKESLGGNSKTFMIATVSPSSLNYNESISTLRYAARAKEIINTVKINEDPNDKLIRILKDEIDILKQQLAVRGSDSSASSDDLRGLREEIAQREELMREKDKSWEQKLAESKEINEQVQERLKKELMQKQVELEMKDAERLAMVKEMENMRSDMTGKTIMELSRKQQELDERQAVFEKDRIVGSAVTLQEYYEKKLEKLKAEYDTKIQAKEQEENTRSIKDIDELKVVNIKLKEELNKNQRDLQLQLRQFTNDRVVFSKQIQQLHNKIHTLEVILPSAESAQTQHLTQAIEPVQPQAIEPVQHTEITMENISDETREKLNEYNRIAQLRIEEENKYQLLQQECKKLNEKITADSAELHLLELKHSDLIADVDRKTSDLKQLRTDYAALADKFTADKSEYDLLITNKEILHTEIITLKNQLDIQVEIAKEKLKNPTIDDLLKIKDGLACIFESIQRRT